jgi:divalent metal cation (Fe/Co/Zn/Cd) transporter
MFALFEGVDKLRHPHQLESAGWAVGILFVSMLLEGFSFRTAVHEAKRSKGPESWWKFIRRSKTPELPVVLLEDFGALIGLTLALVGVGLAEVTGNARFDAMGSVAIAILLAAIAITLVVEMKSLLIGEAASPAVVARICAAMGSSDQVLSVIHLRTEHLGPDELLVGAKVAFDTSLDLYGLAAAIDEVEASVRAAVPEARVIYIEPDVRKPVDDAGRVLEAPSPA